VAGIAAAAANNGVGIAGLSWGANLISLKVFPDGLCNPAGDCPGTCTATAASILAALNYVRTKIVGTAGLKAVVNMSLGNSPAPPCSGADATELGLDVAAGIPVVMAAGNDSGAVNEPANCAGTTGGSGLIPVTSVDGNNIPSYFTSRGPEVSANGVAAPGENIETTDINNSYTGGASGTSFSSPQVAGLAALVLSAKPAFTPAQIQSAIRGGADQIGQAATVQGSGRINVFRTLRLAARGTLADFAGDQKAIAFPNPFRVAQNGAVSITIPVALQGANAKVVVYSADGQVVRTVRGLTWDGKNDNGNLVASGTYVFNVTTDNGHTTGRVAVIR
jgi:subtilisin family serine protease